MLATVADPEIPIISVVDLGIVREINVAGDTGQVEVVITPTYSGCPAMREIESDIVATLRDAGISGATVRTILAPPWTTDWISAAGRGKLEHYGIAPPAAVDHGSLPAQAQVLSAHVKCPQCGSLNTSVVSPFGSTACKALYRCDQCLEPFDYFKPI